MLNKQDKQKRMQDFGKSQNDTGSSAVQAAVLSSRIEQLTEHCRQHPKDMSSDRGLRILVSKRRRHLNYLKKKSSAQEYKELIERLGLRK